MDVVQVVRGSINRLYSLMMVLGSLLHARKPGVPTNEVWAKHEPPASLCAERKAWHFACWGEV